MAIDAFSAQIVELVRRMPDAALLELVKFQLGAPPLRKLEAAALRAQRGRARQAAAKKTTKRAASAPKRHAARSPKVRPVSAERQEMLANVERIVKAGAGVSASDVASSAGIPQTRAAAALKELKLTKRIFQGGDRRFARYAGELKLAEEASASARKTAKGPTTNAAKKPVKRGKKAAAAK